MTNRQPTRLNSQTPLFSDPKIAEQIAFMQELPQRDAVYAQAKRPFHKSLQARLDALKIDKLYTHQAQAYDQAILGKDLVIATGTNSGKTLCYNLPAMQICAAEPAARCLYLFPTKALAQDQLGRLEILAPGPEIRMGTYDGDTPKTHRATLRKMAHILLTNPDMLHLGILPGHELWAKYFKSLRLIVIDEMHVYRGVFGSHVGNVVRRLLRLCAWHNSRPQIIACSATIGNPEQLFEKLTGRKAVLIDEDGSPSGKRTFVFWNPPELGNGQRLSANIATSEILASLAEVGMRTIAFNRARISAELVLRYTQKRVESGGIVPPKKLESYRAGYTPKERREIEKALFTGDLLGLSSTNAMELGVDVGQLDAVIMNGYPGTASSFWQQAGRAGRGSREGLAVFVAHDDPLEQFLVRNPQTLLDQKIESVAVHPENPQILGQHLLCAAHERPISPSELTRFGPTALETAESLDRSGELEFRAGMFFYPAIEGPAAKVNIRSGGGDTIRLMSGEKEIGNMEQWRAMNCAHQGAIYLHRGTTYYVNSLDLEAKTAELEERSVDYYTQSLGQTVLDPRSNFWEVQVGIFKVGMAGVTVTDSVTGYRLKSLDGDTVMGTETLDFPPITYDTICVRIDLPALLEDKDMESQLGGIHGVEHALLAVAPILAGCDRGDLGSAWYSMFFDTLRPAVFVFDRTPGGVGLCERLFESVTGWVRAASQLLSTCDCETGCPACLLSSRCESFNEVLNKQAALQLLKDALR
jgi:DEAD/DEAH box helicase domain-containing protein